MTYVIITTTGRAKKGLRLVKNNEFSDDTFYDQKTGRPYDKSTAQILEEFERTTGIKDKAHEGRMLVPGITSRLHAKPGVTTTDLGVEALKDTGFNLEDIDDLVVATNFADAEVKWLPAMAVQTMNRLGIDNGSGVIGVDFMCDDRTGELVAWKLQESEQLGRVYYGDLSGVTDVRELGSPLPNYLIHQAKLQGEDSSVAARIKNRLGIRNPQMKMRDVPWGCAGSLEAVIQEKALIEGGHIHTAGIVSVENLPENVDPFDRDKLLYAAGGAAVILEAGNQDTKGLRILAYEHQTHADFMDYLTMGPSYNPDHPGSFMKMNGREVFGWFMRHMKEAIDISLERAGEVLGRTISPEDVALWNLHQPQPRLIYKIMQNSFGMSMEEIDRKVPITAGTEGNPSVVSNPRILDGCYKGEWNDKYRLNRGDIVVMGSGGAGMNIASVVGIMQ